MDEKIFMWIWAAKLSLLINFQKFLIGLRHLQCNFKNLNWYKACMIRAAALEGKKKVWVLKWESQNYDNWRSYQLFINPPWKPERERRAKPNGFLWTSKQKENSSSEGSDCSQGKRIQKGWSLLGLGALCHYDNVNMAIVWLMLKSPVSYSLILS